jgi:hypothetical protein
METEFRHVDGSPKSTFLTNPFLVLLYVARNPDDLIRQG